MERGSRRTRSQAAPDWTVQECLILVNEINAIEGEWKHTLPSFQKWQFVVENCNALDVNRSLNQCKTKWESLLGLYNLIKPYETGYWAFDESKRAQLGLPQNFSAEIFQAVDNYVVTTAGAKGGDGEGDGDEDEAGAGGVGQDWGPDSDAEGYFEAAPDDVDLPAEGSKKQQKRKLPQKRKVDERSNPWKHAISRNEKQKQYILNGKVKAEPCSPEYNLDEMVESPKGRTAGNLKLEPSTSEHNSDEKVEPRKSCTIGKLKLEPNGVEAEEQIIATDLMENARMINAVLEGNLGDDVDCKPADTKSDEASQNDFIRLQGDKLIHFLGKFAGSLNQLCDGLQECN